MTEKEQPTVKTWSRETAVVLLGVLCWAVLGMQDVEMVQTIIWPFVTYAAIAFGLKRIDTSDKLWR